MRAAIYARYSSENQRPESIDDQISSCRKVADHRTYTVEDRHIYSDEAASGARKDRAGLAALLSASERHEFEILLVDDLSRLARDNYLMLTVLAELRFNRVRVISVADGLDSEDNEATIGIQMRGIFNELQLADLKKKTLRGQLGQKERGFFVGERTFGYKSTPVGVLRMDKKGRPRPEGYGMAIDPREAAIVLRLFQEYADGSPICRLVRCLNSEGVPGRMRASKGWSAATVSRILANTKYIGKWVWNRTETRRDPRTGRRRSYQKPEADWVVRQDETLRIVPQDLWDRVQERQRASSQTSPNLSPGRRLGSRRESWARHFPKSLLSGCMVCGSCGAAIVQVGGKGGGYFGCLGAKKGGCQNGLIVRRRLAEKVILRDMARQFSSPSAIQYVLQQVEREVSKLYKDVPETIRAKQVELQTETRRLANFVNFVAEARGSRAIAEALEVTETRVNKLRAEVEGLERAQNSVFRAPPIEWITERLGTFQEVLERRT